MAIKDNIDFSTFSDSLAAFDLFSNSIRRSFTYDSYGNKTKFTAVVLSNPIPISPTDLEYFKAGGKDPSDKVSKFVYRARILGENSPHQFLPNPCDTTYASDVDAALQIVAMHTLFVSTVEEGVGKSLPRLNSTVEVELTKNAFSYNLQYGKHLSVVDNPSGPSTSTAACDKLSEIMAFAPGAPIWSYESGENNGGPPLDDPKVKEVYAEYIRMTGGKFAPASGMCGNLPGFPLEKCKKGNIGGVNVTLHPKFFEIVKQKYDMVKAQNFNEKFAGGSTIRTAETQIRLRINNATRPLSAKDYITKGSSVCNPPTAPLPTGPGKGSRHIYGCAIDFGGILLTGGTKVAKLSNSTARKSKTYKFLLTLQETGFKNYSKEPWHWSIDGN